ncbi:MAG: S41 family peptidase [Lachnospiraceae bacterium]|nr:S41 family peptidase [Lachnospiraceae bacterium]
MDREELKRARRAGRWQGALIMAGIAVFIALLFLTIGLARKIRNGTILSLLNFGGTSESVITSEVTDKADTLKAVIDTYYYEDVDEEALKNGIYKGLMEGLGDPYSTYYTEEEYREMMESSEGVYEGIGAVLQQDSESMLIKVVRPIPGSPAEEAGLLAEDIIMEVDGEDITGQDINVVVSKIRGESGTKVNIGIARSGEDKTLYFDITRAKVEDVTVDHEMLEDNIGYIFISEFDDVTTRQFTDAMEDLKEQGMDALILDLRDNPGGNLDVAVDVADYILPEGLVVYMEDKYGERDEYRSDASHHWDKPIAVLVNGNSASASEIVCGALRDYDRATLVGTKTYGKGIVQQILPLGDGSGVKVTIARYYTPNGTCIHGEGFEPDVEVDFDLDLYLEEDTDTQLIKAIEVLKEKL